MLLSFPSKEVFLTKKNKKNNVNIVKILLVNNIDIILTFFNKTSNNINKTLFLVNFF